MCFVMLIFVNKAWSTIFLFSWFKNHGPNIKNCREREREKTNNIFVSLIHTNKIPINKIHINYILKPYSDRVPSSIYKKQPQGWSLNKCQLIWYAKNG